MNHQMQQARNIGLEALCGRGFACAIHDRMALHPE
jgi:hypothetical protein